MCACIEPVHNGHIKVHDDQPVYRVWAHLIGTAGLKLGFEHIHCLFAVGGFIDLDLVSIVCRVTLHFAYLGSTVRVYVTVWVLVRLH